MKSSTLFTIAAIASLFSLNTYAANYYCPQGFDADCHEGNAPSCSYSHYKSDLPRIPGLVVDGGYSGKFKNLTFIFAQWQGDNAVFGDLIICNYVSGSGKQLSFFAPNLHGIKPIVSKSTSWKPAFGYPPKYKNCRSKSSSQCPVG